MPFFLVIFSAIVMQLRWLDFGLNPNVFIAMLSAYAFFSDSQYIFTLATLVGIAILKYKPEFEGASFSLILISLFIFLSRKILPIFSVVVVGFIAVISTVLFYGLSNYHIIILHTKLVFLESLYNAILSIVFYLILKLIHGEER